MRITVIGGGSWGTALANLVAKANHETTLLVRNADCVLEIIQERSNNRYLPGVLLHERLTATTAADQALRHAEICLLAIPTQNLGQSLRELASFFPKDTIPVCVSKGIEAGTLFRMQQVVARECPKIASRYAMLSGPSFAQDVALEKPAAVVLACEDPALGTMLRKVFSTETFRVYSSTDVIGVECGGAMKNVMAIAAGFCDGMELGDSARAGLITRGLAEISRLGVALGGETATFMGLSGMGDLVLTCTGNLSRNRRVGFLLGQGMGLDAAVCSLGQVAEGVKTTEAVCALASRLGIEVPVSKTVASVMLEGLSPKDSVRLLMTRDLKKE